MKGTKVQTLSVVHTWCLGSYADLAYSSYSDAHSDAQASIL